MIDQYPKAHPNAFRELGDLPPPPDTLSRDAAFFNTELPTLFDKSSPTRHLHQTGQSLVYEGIDEGIRTVVKVNYQEIQRTFGHMTRTSTALSDAHDALRTERLARIRDFRERREILRQHFGEAVPSELWELKTIDLPGSTLQYILSENCNNGQLVPPSLVLNDTYQIETLVRTQNYDPIFEDPERVTTATRYAEFIWYSKAAKDTEPLNIDAYVAITELLTQPGVTNLTLENSGDILRALIELQDSVWLERILTKTVHNPLLAAGVRDFLFKLDAHHKATGGMTVDVIGIDNIIFDDQGRCHMGDALETQNIPMLTVAQSVLNDIAQGKLPSSEEADILINILNYIRGINALAIASESPVRIMLPLPYGADHELVWKRVLALVERDESYAPHRIPADQDLVRAWNGK